jgi:hypothetical protein
VLELYAIADGRTGPGPGDPTVVICMDEFGPLSLQPHPGKQWAPQGVGQGGALVGGGCGGMPKASSLPPRLISDESWPLVRR